MNIIDLIIFLLFTGGVVVFGTVFSKRRTVSEYTAGTTFSWAVGMSIFATYISSISYLGNPDNPTFATGTGCYSVYPFL
ncbi:hypothetical protein MASR1M31_09730 [Porphyromonadaceae bacterium]